MDTREIKDLNRFAKEIRLHTIQSLAHLGFGHYGGSLSIVEVLAVLYGKVMNVNPKDPSMRERDYFILSKGHAGPALYAALALRGFFDKDVLFTLNQGGTKLPSHPDRQLTLGVDMTTGSLGQGISVACGVAKSFKIDHKNQWVYCILGDGELNEGQCWEAMQFAVHQELNQLIVFLDENKKQLDGTTDEVSRGFCYESKFKSFGFDTKRVDGRDVKAIESAIAEAKNVKDKPHIILLDTIKGQGFPYMEQKADNHHVRPSEEEKLIIQNYIQDLKKELGGVQNA